MLETIVCPHQVSSTGTTCSASLNDLALQSTRAFLTSDFLSIPSEQLQIIWMIKQVIKTVSDSFDNNPLYPSYHIDQYLQGVLESHQVQENHNEILQ